MPFSSIGEDSYRAAESDWNGQVEWDDADLEWLRNPNIFVGASCPDKGSILMLVADTDSDTRILGT